MVNTAIVLAGGLGTRLRSVLPDVPKPMAPVHGRPFLAYLFDYWKAQGIARFIVSVGYKHHHIIEYFGNSYHGVEIEYVIESTPLGTGGGLLLSVTRIKEEAPFLLLNGDTYFAVDLQQLTNFAEINQADYCFSLFKTLDHQRYLGLKTTAEGRILSFQGQEQKEAVLANGGVYWIRHPSVLAYPFKDDQPLSLEKDIFPAALTSQQRLFGLEFSGMFTDIGLPVDYQNASQLLTQ